MRLGQEANINVVLMFQFHLPAATISVPIFQLQRFPPFVLGRTPIFGCELDDGFEDSSRSSFSC
jgi:hypothetical protein